MRAVLSVLVLAAIAGVVLVAGANDHAEAAAGPDLCMRTDWCD